MVHRRLLTNMGLIHIWPDISSANWRWLVIALSPFWTSVLILFIILQYTSEFEIHYPDHGKNTSEFEIHYPDHGINTSEFKIHILTMA